MRGEDSGEDVHSRVGPMERTRLGTRTWTLSLPLLSLTSHLRRALSCVPCVHARVLLHAHTPHTTHTHTQLSNPARG